MPQYAAGWRIEPPVSVPIAAKHIPAATAAAAAVTKKPFLDLVAAQVISAAEPDEAVELGRRDSCGGHDREPALVHRRDVVRRRIAIQIIFLDVILYSAGGVIGTEL